MYQQPEVRHRRSGGRHPLNGDGLLCHPCRSCQAAPQQLPSAGGAVSGSGGGESQAQDKAEQAPARRAAFGACIRAASCRAACWALVVQLHLNLHGKGSGCRKAGRQAQVQHLDTVGRQ